MRLSVGRFLKILFSSFFIQTSWSFFSMQGMGFLFNLVIGTRKEEKKHVLKTHQGYFNTHPYMASYIIGATLRAYDEAQASSDEIQKFITVAQTSFASAGDLLFWQTIRPALLLLAVIVGTRYGIIGPLIFLVVFNALHLYHRAQGIWDGYNLGRDVIYRLKSKRFTTVQRVFECLGALCSGLLCALIVLKANYLLLIPLTLLFLILLVRRFPAILFTIAVLLLVIIISVV
jgi:mannose/fructose/N-acetylgalactosamine-specific phosphotransferase system component IID